MFRRHENPDALKAGLLALAVHALLLGGLFFSFNWKAAHQNLNVTEVELWDKLPTNAAPPKAEVQQEMKPEPAPELPKNEPKSEPKDEPKPDEQAEQNMREEAEIALKKEQKAKEAEKLKLEKLEKEKLEKEKQEKEAKEKTAKEQALEQIKREAREEELRAEKQAKKEKQEKREKQDALKRLQQEMLGEDSATDDKAAQAANASAITEFTDKIKAKIRGNVNKTLCGEGNPELRFQISVLPTGDLSGSPKLKQSSGSGACDEAVERAIIASQPLPLPSDVALKARFRNLNLKFRPND